MWNGQFIWIKMASVCVCARVMSLLESDAVLKLWFFYL